MTQAPASKAELARQIRSGQHIPDILDCLAQLSNDEVPTPPKLADAMLNILPDEVWSDPDYKWLDPFCKSGVFLREIAVRLLDGLSDQIPNFEERREHIYRDMLWGTSITEMTGMIARRSVYYSRDASGSASVIKFDTATGNLPFVRTNHEFVNSRTSCVRCGSAPEIERGNDRENHAYAFIHGAYPTKEMSDMKFDVIVGNPPYQLKGGGGGTNDSPVYQVFVENAVALKPRHIVMITPSRWFTGGRGLDDFRANMISDRRIEKLVDNPKLFDCFPGVEIKGGVAYFLWSRDHDGDVEFQTRIEGQVISSASRDLRDGLGVVVRDNEAASIIAKVQAVGEPSLSAKISPDTPFGLATNFADFALAPFDGAVRLYKRGLADAWVDGSAIAKNAQWIEPIKVMLPEAGDGHGRIPAIVLGQPFVAEANSVCTQTFLVAGLFQAAENAENAVAYLGTKFVRFLVLQRKISQHTRPGVFKFVPDLPMDRIWTDDDLYARYGLTADEIAYVESQIKPMTPAAEDDE